MNLIEAWALVSKHHVYEADALQISTAKEAGCDVPFALTDASSKPPETRYRRNRYRGGT